MKLAFTAVTLSVVAALTACQTQNVSKPSHTPVSEVKHVNTNALEKTLEQYTWAYQPKGTNEPIVLSFANQNINIDTGCNMAFGGYTLSDSTLKVERMAMTAKMCSPELMKQEAFAGSLFSQAEIKLKLDQSDPLKPVLNIQKGSNETYQFVGTQTSETKYQSQADIIFLEISPETKDCVGIAPQKCLQVREIKYSDSGLKTNVGDWQLFYDKIEGFEHDANTRQVVRLKRFMIKNPAVDQSKFAYVHDMTVENEWLK